MQQSVGQRPVTAPAVVGLLLIITGGVALAARATGFNLFEAIGPWGWPLFIIVPGLVLLASSLIPTRPNGIGFATAGAIVTAVGLLLLYQWQTNHFESWAYAWALLPAAAGLGQLAYGLYAGEHGMISRGLWLAAIGGGMFAIGAWFFEGIFAGEPRPSGIDWWPIGLIVIGGIVVAGGRLRPGPARTPTAAPSRPEPAQGLSQPGPQPTEPTEPTRPI